MTHLNRRRMLGGLAAMFCGIALPRGLVAAKDGSMTGIELKVRQRLRHSGVLSAAWSPDGRRLVSAGHPYILWDPFTGEKLHELNEPWAAFVVHAPVRFTADGRHVVVVSDNANIDGVQVGFGLWNVETGRLDRQIPVPKTYFPSGKGGKPWFLPIPGKRQAIVMYITDPGWPILIYDTDTWEVLGSPLRIPEGGRTGDRRVSRWPIAGHR
ncbi:MAG: hypothetical protein Q7R40_13915 [Phaeospirillum sp.]|nr:hypothetical protein [Phaeospirillum sp.]